jgi:hypothetical protein
MPTGRQRTTTPVISGWGREHQHVHRIAVVGDGVRDVAVVAGIVHGRRHEAVDEHRAGLLVHFVLDRIGIHRDFDDDVEVVGDVSPRGHAVEIHGRLPA